MTLVVGLLAIFSLSVAEAPAQGVKVRLKLSKDDSLAVYCFVPQFPVRYRLPGVICAVGAGSTKILQYHLHCQALANRGFYVLLLDPADYPEALVPGPFSWDKMPGYAIGGVNQAVVAARLLFDKDWYLRSIRAAVNFLSSSPYVEASKIALSGFSQPANAALMYASDDWRIRAVVWNYGGWPWVLPYDPMTLPPVLILHGAEDDVYDVKYAYRLARHLAAAGKYHELYVYPGESHMFNVYFDPRTETRAMKPAIHDSFERMVSFLCRTMGIATRLPARPGQTPPSARPGR
jgi:dienelactone hydrolase